MIYPKPPRIKVHVASRFSPLIKHPVPPLKVKRLLFENFHTEIQFQKASKVPCRTSSEIWKIKNPSPISTESQKKTPKFHQKSAQCFSSPRFCCSTFWFSKKAQQIRFPRGGIFGGTQALEIAPATSKLILIIPEKKKKQVVPYENLWTCLSISQQKKNHECLYDLRLPQWTLVLFTTKINLRSSCFPRLKSRRVTLTYGF